MDKNFDAVVTKAFGDYAIGQRVKGEEAAELLEAHPSRVVRVAPLPAEETPADPEAPHDESQQ